MNSHWVQKLHEVIYDERTCLPDFLDTRIGQYCLNEAFEAALVQKAFLYKQEVAALDLQEQDLVSDTLRTCIDLPVREEKVLADDTGVQPTIPAPKPREKPNKGLKQIAHVSNPPTTISTPPQSENLSKDVDTYIRFRRNEKMRKILQQFRTLAKENPNLHFTLDHQTGSHGIYRNPDGSGFTLPQKKAVSSKVLKGVEKQLNKIKGEGERKN